MYLFQAPKWTAVNGRVLGIRESWKWLTTVRVHEYITTQHAICLAAFLNLRFSFSSEAHPPTSKHVLSIWSFVQKEPNHVSFVNKFEPLVPEIYQSPPSITSLL